MFIVIDGPDGTGKTTVVKALAQRLARLPGVTVKETHEPYTPWLREWLSDPTVQARELLVGFAHDRNLHLREVVEPALARGEVVLCDRYTYSTIAYQTLHNPPELVRGLVEGVRKPDLCVVLTCPLDIAMERIVARGLPPDRYDHKREIQAKVAAAYKECAAADDFAVTVDASGTREETLEDAWGVVLLALYARGVITREIASRFRDGHGKPCERLDYSKPPDGYTVSTQGWSAYSGAWALVGTANAYTYPDALGWAWVHYKRMNDPPLPHHPWRSHGYAGHKFEFAFTTPEGGTILTTTDRPDDMARAAAWRWYDTNVIGVSGEAARIAADLVRMGCPVEDDA